MSLKESLSENIKTKEAELKRMSETLATLSNELHDVGSPHAALRTQQRVSDQTSKYIQLIHEFICFFILLKIREERKQPSDPAG